MDTPPPPPVEPCCSPTPYILSSPLQTIHNVCHSRHITVCGALFCLKLVTMSSSYPNTSSPLFPSLTLSPPWPPRSQCIHALPFVSAQSKQAATEGREGPGEGVRDNKRGTMMNEGEEKWVRADWNWEILSRLHCIPSIFSALIFHLTFWGEEGNDGREMVDVECIKSDTSRWGWKDC